MRLLKLVSVCLGLMVFAACDTLEKIETARMLADIAGDTNAARVRVLGDPLSGRRGLPGTSYNAIPASGTAVFSGTSVLSVSQSNDPSAAFRLLGRTEMQVNFGTEAITGQMDEFVFVRDTTDIATTSGRLSYQGGEIGRLRPNTFEVDYGGTLTVNGEAYVFDGDLAGQFRGTRPNPAAGQSPVRAVSAVDANGTATAGGSTFDVRAVVIAEN